VIKDAAGRGVSYASFDVVTAKGMFVRQGEQANRTGAFVVTGLPAGSSYAIRVFATPITLAHSGTVTRYSGNQTCYKDATRFPVLAGQTTSAGTITVPVLRRPSSSVHRPGWLEALDAARAAAGLAPVAADATLIDDLAVHLNYLAETGKFQHQEDRSDPGYTDVGNQAGLSSDLLGEGLPPYTGETSKPDCSHDTVSASGGAFDISYWLGAPYHAAAMLDPRQEGAGLATSGVAGLNLADWGARDVTAPALVTYPSPRAALGQLVYSGNESPDPLAGCPGGFGRNPGFPIVLLPRRRASTLHASVRTGTTSIRVCIVRGFNEEVFVIPHDPLRYRHTYHLTFHNGGTTYHTSFHTVPRWDVYASGTSVWSAGHHDPSTNRLSVSLTAMVSGANGHAPFGRVRFAYRSGRNWVGLGRPTLDRNGYAHLSTSTIGSRNVPIRATYLGARHIARSYGTTTYHAPPKVTGLSIHGSVLAAGERVTVSGARFDHVRSVSFGAVLGTAVKLISPTQLSVVAPSQLPRTVDVRVSTVYGRSVATPADRYTYTFAPIPWGVPVTIDAGGGLQAVSCATASFCATVDSVGHIITFNGSTWSTLVRVGSLGTQWWDVSCPTAAFCLAVGQRADTAAVTTTFDGTSWSAPELAPVGTDVSCVSATYCVADSQSSFAIEVFNGTGWTASGATSFQPTDLDCVSATWCMLAGDNASSTFDGASTISAPIQASGITIISVSCVSSALCAALGGDGQAIVYNGSTWSAPTGVVESPAAAVSCSSATHCIASSGAGYTKADNGTGWIDGSPTGLSTLHGIDCPTDTFCVAVGGSQAVHLGP
jgi:hypothetical protein